MYQLNSDRLALDLGGPSVEVEPILSWAIQHEFMRLWASFIGATKPEGEYDALAAMCDRFITEAMPSWDFADHRGVIPVTGRGMMRLPIDRQLAMFQQWMASLVVAEEAEPDRTPIAGLSVVESDAPTAVDAVLPPGPANREVKRRLRVAKKAA